jgi:hypothetical protein
MVCDRGDSSSAVVASVLSQCSAVEVWTYDVDSEVAETSVLEAVKKALGASLLEKLGHATYVDETSKRVALRDNNLEKCQCPTRWLVAS